MSYNDNKRKGNRIYVVMFEIDLDINDPTFDTDFANEAGSFGTPKTTEDSRAYLEGSVRTYRYCSQLIPYAEHYYPNLGEDSVQSSMPAVLHPGKRISMSAQATVTLKDFDDNDSYQLQGEYSGKRLPNPGSHFKRLLARNYIENRPARIKRGYVPDSGVMTDADFQIEHYVVQSVTDPDKDGQVKFSLIDRLFFTSSKKAKAPITSNATTTSIIPETGSTGNVTFLCETFGDKGINDTAPAVNDSIILNIDNELFQGTITAYNPSTFVGTFNYTARGLGSSRQVEHGIDSSMQGVIHYDGVNITDILTDLITRFSKLNPSFINTTGWANLKSGDLSHLQLTTYLTQPSELSSLFTDLIRTTGIWMYMDVVTNFIELGITPRFATPDLHISPDLMLKNTLISKPAPDDQVTRSVIRYGKRDYTEGNSVRNYSRAYRRQNDVLEADEAYAQVSEDDEIKSDWLTTTNADTIIAQGVAALKVERFAQMPRRHTFSVDSSIIGDLENGNRLWYGSVISLENPFRVNLDDTPKIETAQVVSIKRTNQIDTWQIVALSYEAEALPDVTADLTISANARNVNLHSLINPTQAREYVVIIEMGVIIGSTSNNVASLTTGTGWPAGSSLLIYNLGQILGKGGNGGDGGEQDSEITIPPFSGQPGGDAIEMHVDLSIDNLQGLIGGGGAGAKGGVAPTVGSQGGGGGGGAGDQPGSGAVPNGSDGSYSFGGKGGTALNGGIVGDDGGALGEDRPAVSGPDIEAGLAIRKVAGNITILNGDNPNQIKGRIV